MQLPISSPHTVLFVETAEFGELIVNHMFHCIHPFIPFAFVPVRRKRLREHFAKVFLTPV